MATWSTSEAGRLFQMSNSQLFATLLNSGPLVTTPLQHLPI